MMTLKIDYLAAVALPVNTLLTSPGFSCISN
jgi:hypothetical protein